MTAVSTSLPAGLSGSTTSKGPAPSVDSVNDYLGVSAFEYGELDGEIRYRTVTREGTTAQDGVCQISQGVIGQDSNIVTQNRVKDDEVVNGHLSLSVTRAPVSSNPPEEYTEFEDELKECAKALEQGDLLTSVSIDNLPGMIFHYIGSEPDTGDDLSFLWYGQALPWGLLQWEFFYDQGLDIGTPAVDHHEWLRQRIDRDWEAPSLATHKHWSEVHRPGVSKKILSYGDISQIKSRPPVEPDDIERVDNGFQDSLEVL